MEHLDQYVGQNILLVVVEVLLNVDQLLITVLVELGEVVTDLKQA
jgi:CYTH domain-containing protein